MKKASEQRRTSPAKKPRNTVNKQIAGGSTHAQQWQIAINGGSPPTPIQRFAQSVAGLNGPLPDNFGSGWEEWQDGAIKRAQEEFVGLFFPALLRDDTKPLEELIQALADRRKERNRGKRPISKKVEKGRRLRLALLTMTPAERLNIKTVKENLSRWGAEYTDDPAIYSAMKELGLQFVPRVRD